MVLNRRQRNVLLLCAVAVVAMLVYPPLHFKGYGRGYGWIFAATGGLTVNVMQLLVQWVGVAVVGAVALVLMSAEPGSEEAANRRGAAGAAGRAFVATRHWLWMLVAIVAVALVIDPIRGAGQLAAAILLYGLILGLRWFNESKSGVVVSAAAGTPRTAAALIGIALLIMAGAFTYVAIQSPTDRPATSTRLLTDQEVFGRSEGGNLHPSDSATEPASGATGSAAK